MARDSSAILMACTDDCRTLSPVTHSRFDSGDAKPRQRRLRGYSTMVVQQPSKLNTRVRFPLPAPILIGNLPLSRRSLRGIRSSYRLSGLVQSTPNSFRSSNEIAHEEIQHGARYGLHVSLISINSFALPQSFHRYYPELTNLVYFRMSSRSLPAKVDTPQTAAACTVKSIPTTTWDPTRSMVEVLQRRLLSVGVQTVMLAYNLA